MITNNIWTEKWRPQSIDDCVLPENLKTSFKKFIENKEVPNLLFSGSAGVGKTTSAKALCREIGCDYIVINSSDESGIDVLRTKIKSFASSISLSSYGMPKVVILDEADNLQANSFQPALRNFMEEFSSNCRFILTCNYPQKIIEPLLSRLTIFNFNIPSKQKVKIATQMMKRVEHILTRESVEFDAKVLPEVIMKFFPDFRKTISELQSYYTRVGKIDIGILSQLDSIDVSVLIKHLKEKNFTSMRKFVNENLDSDPNYIIRSLFTNLDKHLEPISFASIILILADYQYKSAFVADHELNLTAMLIMIMSEAIFKTT